MVRDNLTAASESAPDGMASLSAQHIFENRKVLAVIHAQIVKQEASLASLSDLKLHVEQWLAGGFRYRWDHLPAAIWRIGHHLEGSRRANGIGEVNEDVPDTAVNLLEQSGSIFCRPARRLLLLPCEFPAFHFGQEPVLVWHRLVPGFHEVRMAGCEVT